MELDPHPEIVEYKSSEDLLHITFSNGVERTIYVPSLRGFCPCARCQGHGGGPHRWVPLLGELSIKIVEVNAVGTYAMSIIWEDGHDTGIYTFRNLIVWPTAESFSKSVVEGMEEGETMVEVLNRIGKEPD